MDDKRLGELFRTAAASVDPPAARFDHDDVLAGSRRLARRQRVLVTAAVVAVAGLGFGAVAGGGLLRTGPASTLAEAPAAGPSTESAPPGPAGARDSDGAGAGDDVRSGGAGPGSDAASGAAGSGGSTLESAPAPGAAPDAAAPRMAPTPFAVPPGALAQDPDAAARSKAAPGFVAGCAKPDTEVFAQLTAVLPELRGHAPRPVPGGCAEGGVGVAVTVNGGTLAVVVTPAGVPDPTPANSATRRSAVVEARSGRTVRVTTTGPIAPPPYSDRLPALARDVAARL